MAATSAHGGFDAPGHGPRHVDPNQPHVHIVYSSIMKLEADAHAVPTASEPSSWQYFWMAYPDNLSRHDMQYHDLHHLYPGDDVRPLKSRVCRVKLRRHRNAKYSRYTGPAKYTVNVVGSRRHFVSQGIDKIDWLAQAAKLYVHLAAADLRSRDVPIRNGKPKYLLALPVIGTGAGGARHSVGKVLRALLKALIVESQAVGVDVALVTIEKDVFAAAQVERRRLVAEGSLHFPISGHLRTHAARLARLALQGRLTFFLGAGISAGAGMPLWSQLLDDLAEEVGLGPSIDKDRRQDAEAAAEEPSGSPFPPHLAARICKLAMGTAKRQRQEFTWLNPMDKARVIQQRLEVHGKSLGELVAARLQNDFHAVAHAHLAAMPVKEVATTNYDQLFEQAVRCTRGEIDVLPHSPGQRGSEGRWILKMHGCVTVPDTIVLTRQDYIRYQEQYSALGGILMSALLTRHIMFVGFSLSDDNFARLYDAAAKARPKREAPAADPFITLAAAGAWPNPPRGREIPRSDADAAAAAAAATASAAAAEGEADSHSVITSTSTEDGVSRASLPSVAPGSLPDVLHSAVQRLPTAYHYAVRYSPMLADVLKMHIQNEAVADGTTDASAEDGYVSPTSQAAALRLMHKMPSPPRLGARQVSTGSCEARATNRMMGTVLAFSVNTLQRELWGHDLAFAYVHNRDFEFLEQERARLRRRRALASQAAAQPAPTAYPASSYPTESEPVDASALGIGALPEEIVGDGDPVPDAEPDEDLDGDDVLFAGLPEPSIGAMARIHDIFLDYLSFLATTSTPHLLVARFESLLSPAELELKRVLERMLTDVAESHPEATQAGEWSSVQRMLHDLGGFELLRGAERVMRSRQAGPPTQPGEVRRSTLRQQRRK